MAHEHATEPVDDELEGKWPCGDAFAPRVQAPCAPLPDGALAPFDGKPIDVAADEVGADICATVEDLGGPGSGARVARDDDLVDVFALDLGEDGLERRQVAVDVAQRGDTHVAKLPRE